MNYKSSNFTAASFYSYIGSLAVRWEVLYVVYWPAQQCVQQSVQNVHLCVLVTKLITMRCANCGLLTWQTATEDDFISTDVSSVHAAAAYRRTTAASSVQLLHACRRTIASSTHNSKEMHTKNQMNSIIQSQHDNTFDEIIEILYLLMHYFIFLMDGDC